MPLLSSGGVDRILDPCLAELRRGWTRAGGSTYVHSVQLIVHAIVRIDVCFRPRTIDHPTRLRHPTMDHAQINKNGTVFGLYDVLNT